MSVHPSVGAREPRAGARCAACGGAWRGVALFQVRGYAIERCGGCGIARTMLPEGFDPRGIYGADYFAGGHDDGYADYVGSEKVLRAEFRAALAHLIRSGTYAGRLLEVGCAYGFFLEEASSRFEVVGIEVAADAAAACAARGLDVREGVLEESFFRDREPFDAIVMLDVIEHLERPDEIVDTISRHTKRGGRLLASTGDWGSITARMLGPRWRLMTPPQHLWFFTVPTMRTLLERHGFRLESVQHPWKFVPASLIAYQLGRMTGLQDRLRRLDFGRLGLPVNLYDAMRLVAVKV